MNDYFKFKLQWSRALGAIFKGKGILLSLYAG